MKTRVMSKPLQAIIGNLIRKKLMNYLFPNYSNPIDKQHPFAIVSHVAYTYGTHPQKNVLFGQNDYIEEFIWGGNLVNKTRLNSYVEGRLFRILEVRMFDVLFSDQEKALGDPRDMVPTISLSKFSYLEQGEKEWKVAI